ncbi:chaperone protein dnaJ 49-like [Tripterygium wilfordii]|uniref:chaperone protein dnaJ 49-like n=1 Tax=Tripterygium wilfordii TaxID=458696 RepID=UPI0018F83D31|nr:chaperone protein dnaJ 49-like [Tripterygium wilfordii]XP_038695693.1 chaperone protein dnaJ 49-like [Tripterygium wilfordii]
MDGNKDDALKCLKIGKDAIYSGDRARAVKFLNKARRLDPSLPVDDILSKVENRSSSAGRTANTSTKPSVQYRGTPNGASASSASSSSSSAMYTEDQITIVRQIKKKKDYYEILELERTCSVEDIRKAYKKLSLKVHPDKNRAPGAEEAFKLVSEAFQCLGNEENRRKYDEIGRPSEEPVRRTTRQARQGTNTDIDEIFRKFFGGSPSEEPMRHTTRHARQGYNTNVDADELFRIFFRGWPSEELVRRTTRHKTVSMRGRGSSGNS